MRITSISGGVGGAKLVLGLDRARIDLSVVVNTGDDFVYYGLKICPDIDTTLYTLSGKSNTHLGWGREDESHLVKTEMAALGEDLWFSLGDKDIALHLARARLLEEGMGLTQAIEVLRNRLSIRPRILPMSDFDSPTLIGTAGCVLEFQDYFVRRRCEPIVKNVEYGAREASGTVLDALGERHADGIVICPSNPLLSIGPVLATKGVSEALRERSVPALAVSPIVGGAAVKGPTAKIFRELGLEVSGLGVARRYQGLIDVFVLDVSEKTLAPEIEKLGLQVCITDTMMKTTDDKVRLAEFCLQQLA